MFNYLKYMVTVPRKFIINWAIAPGLYLLILPLAFANTSVEGLLIDTQREAFRGMSENETMMNLLRAGKSLETGKGSEVQRMIKFLFVLACSARLLTGEFPVVEGYPKIYNENMSGNGCFS